jgi:hypothetical protein
MVGIAAAADLGNVAPIKSTPVVPDNPINPDRQGGDTVLSATVIPSLPYGDTGTTAGYVNDYDEACPYTGSTAADVVYSYTPGAAESVDIDLCGSLYDTKVYVYDSGLSLVACNDDFYFDDICGVFVSKLEAVNLAAGNTYYIIIDGYGGSFGDYVLNVGGYEPCVLNCVGTPEGEPTLVDNYVDSYNGGCNYSQTSPVFQPIAGDSNGDAVLCGVSGWYFFNGLTYRDTDWLLLTMGPGGVIDITVDAEYPTSIFELLPQSCPSVAVAQSSGGGACLEGYMTITGYAHGGIVWFWVGPAAWEPMTAEYDYICWFAGLEPDVATQQTTWSNLKALFD